MCHKLYTSRYNMRMHLNTHTGRSVHTCPYCNIQFISRQSYDSHIKVHTSMQTVTGQPTSDDVSSKIITNIDDVTDDMAESPDIEPTNENGPQIVSVKSISEFGYDTHEEIQIEPDIIDDDIIEQNVSITLKMYFSRLTTLCTHLVWMKIASLATLYTTSGYFMRCIVQKFCTCT